MDKTGITGLYSFTLRYTRPGDDAPGDELMGAIESQLGLKLAPAKATVEMIVVDRAEKTPTEN
ncbi:MAG TPA: TIGR03435 family protein [Bryobacteraceae bacterium]|nr:TIGR03435 family protein [Bryobacteraceae bacterium]